MKYIQFNKVLSIVVTVLAVAFTPMAFAKPGDMAGFVVASKGQVVAVDEAGKIRTLKRRSKFYSNEVIKTSVNSSAQLRFKDRAMMKLQEKSQLAISDYHYGGAKDKSNVAIMKLVSGGFRTISGSIGKSNRAAYRVDTPVASIGIRGTDYQVIIDQEKVYTAVWSGGITLENDFGKIDVGMGSDFAFAQVGNNLPPVGIKEMPKNLINHSEVPAIPKAKKAKNTGPVSVAGKPVGPDAGTDGDRPVMPDGGPGEVAGFGQEGDAMPTPPEGEGMTMMDGEGFAPVEGVPDESPVVEPPPVQVNEPKYVITPGGLIFDVSGNLLGVLIGEDAYPVEEFVFVEPNIVKHGPTDTYIGQFENDNLITKKQAELDAAALAGTAGPEGVVAGVVINEEGEVLGYITQDDEFIAANEVNTDPDSGIVTDDEGDIVAVVDEETGEVEEVPEVSIAFVLADYFESDGAGVLYLARFENGDNALFYPDPEGETDEDVIVIPFVADTGPNALPKANHPSITWGRWTDESVLMAAQSGVFDDEEYVYVDGDPLPEFFWLDAKPYDPSSLQARTGNANFELSQLEAGGLSQNLVDGTISNVNVIANSAGGTMAVNFDQGTFNGQLGFGVVVNEGPKAIAISYTGNVFNPDGLTSTATITDPALGQAGQTTGLSSNVAGVVVDTADAFAGAFNVSSGDIGNQGTTALGINGMFIMQEPVATSEGGTNQ